MRKNLRHLHIRRYRQIINTIAKHGFGYVIDQLGLGERKFLFLFNKLKERKNSRTLDRGERIRKIFEELGPTFIKFGQVFSTRPDLLPPDIIRELEKLQDRVAPLPFSKIREQVERELGGPLENYFYSFQEEPLAAASLGQVHKAVLKDEGGTEVVIKVLRPGVQEIVETDLEIIFDLARLAQKHSKWGKVYDLVSMAEEFAHVIREEMNYNIEGKHAERFRDNFSGVKDVYIPRIYWEYTTNGVLTMECAEGIKLKDPDELGRRGFDCKKIAEKLVNIFLKQVLVDGFFHADPHPGNIAVASKGTGTVLIFLDFGMVGSISPHRSKQFADLVKGVSLRNTKQIVKVIKEMGIINKNIDFRELENDVDKLRKRYEELPVREIKIGRVFKEFMSLAFRYNIAVPMEFTILGRAFVTLEGVIQNLYPDLNVLEASRKYARDYFRKKWTPLKISQKAGEAALLFGSMPRKFDNILDLLAEGNLHFKLEHEHLDSFFLYLNRIANKLSFSIVFLAFSIIMGSLIIGSAFGGQTDGFFWHLPVLEIGFLVASGMFLWLIYAILRSGRF